MISIKELKEFYFKWRYNLRNTSFITYTLLGIMVFIYLFGLITNTSYDLIMNGAMINGYVQIGEWWRFITPIFLHLSFLHILMNGITLYYLGTQLEEILGHTRFLVVFLIAGIFGNFASFGFSNYPSAGASTALFGLFGVYLMLGESFRDTILSRIAGNVLLLIVINVVFDLMSPDIDLYGHIGGLISGFLSAYLIGIPMSSNRIPWLKRIISLIILVIFAFLCLKMGYAAN